MNILLITSTCGYLLFHGTFGGGHQNGCAGKPPSPGVGPRCLYNPGCNFGHHSHANDSANGNHQAGDIKQLGLVNRHGRNLGDFNFQHKNQDLLHNGQNQQSDGQVEVHVDKPGNPVQVVVLKPVEDGKRKHQRTKNHQQDAENGAQKSHQVNQYLKKRFQYLPDAVHNKKIDLVLDGPPGDNVVGGQQQVDAFIP